MGFNCDACFQAASFEDLKFVNQLTTPVPKAKHHAREGLALASLHGTRVMRVCCRSYSMRKVLVCRANIYSLRLTVFCFTHLFVRLFSPGSHVFSCLIFLFCFCAHVGDAGSISRRSRTCSRSTLRLRRRSTTRSPTMSGAQTSSRRTKTLQNSIVMGLS